MKAPKKLHKAFSSGFKIPITLEVMYPKVIWEWSKNRDHLEERSKINIYPSTLIDEILSGEKDPTDVLDEEWELYAKYDFPNDRKIAVATHLSKKTDQEFRELMADFEGITNDIVAYLFKEEFDLLHEK